MMNPLDQQTFTNDLFGIPHRAETARTDHTDDDRNNGRTRSRPSHINRGLASESIHRPIVVAPSLNAANGVRQFVMFPPYSAAQRAGAMVRHRHLLLEFETGQVSHLRAPIGWEAAP